MVKFDQCPYCIEAPRARFMNAASGESRREKEKMTGNLIDLNLKVTVNDHYYQCRDCGIFYRFEGEFSGTVGIYDLRLVRITVYEAQKAFQSEFQTQGDFQDALKKLSDSKLLEPGYWKALLKSEIECAREFAAETLADYYKINGQIKELKSLLAHENPGVRLGALWSYAEMPRASYNVDDPRLQMTNGVLCFKPFAKASSVLRLIILRICDKDARIRKIAFRFLKTYFMGKGNELAAKLLKISQDNWSSELKALLIQNSYPSVKQNNYSFICSFLFDEAQWVRNLSLNRIYETMLEADMPFFVDFVKEKSKIHSTHESGLFLKNPRAGLDYVDERD